MTAAGIVLTFRYYASPGRRRWACLGVLLVCAAVWPWANVVGPWANAFGGLMVIVLSGPMARLYEYRHDRRTGVSLESHGMRGWVRGVFIAIGLFVAIGTTVSILMTT